ncbi:MAG TPA: radical SAM protein [Candidatus Lokiarchaeia archaeon]|nr:radical SAM protein [Candidatus Lokiarchaeia archaeon]
MTEETHEFPECFRENGANAVREMLTGLDDESWAGFLDRGRTATDSMFGKRLKVYVPGKKFPAMSVTGSACDLGCKHCNKQYLHGMVPVDTPEKLESALRDLGASGGTGALISGGSTNEGIVEMSRFQDVLGLIKTEMNLALNIHTGLIDAAAATRLHETGIDTISLDLVGDDETIQEIYGLHKTVDDYKRVLVALMNAGFTNEQIIPHICIGLNKGDIIGEYNVLDYINVLDPKLIVFIVIIPPSISTDLDSTGFKLVLPVEVSRVVLTARILFPRAEISLGCMRPGGRIRQEYDLAAFNAGITRIALPTQQLLKTARDRGYQIDRIDSCCAIGL